MMMLFRRKTPKNSTPSPAAPLEDDPWRSGRGRFGLLQFRRGRDQKWHFSGQRPDETVVLVVRRHWWFLVITAWPFILSLLALIGILFLYMFLPNSIPGISQVWLVLVFVAIIACIITGLRFLYRDFILWRVETYIITNKRIINSRGLVQPTRQETPLEKVTQIGIDLDTLWGMLLRYGTVHVYYLGGDLIMKQMPNPKEVKDAIQGITDEIKAKKAPEEKPPVPTDPELAELLGKLAKGKEVKKLPDADAGLVNRRPDRLRGPLRTFGGILRISCDVKYSSGESTVRYIQRSRYVLYRNLALPVLGLFLLIPVNIFFHFYWGISATIAVLLLLTIGYIYTNYVDDVFILTNKRIIDIDRNFVFFYEAHLETEYKQIRDIKVAVPNLIQRLLDIGTVRIETPGNPDTDILMSHVDHPFVIQDGIYVIKSHKEDAEKIEKANKEKEELYKWFSTVVTKMETKVQTKGVPDLQRLDFWTAAERARMLGLRVVLMGEDPSYPNLEPGLVVDQNPPPGTLMQDGGEIHVLLSKRP
jgi:Bacterial PH domain/PASTA domain